MGYFFNVNETEDFIMETCFSCGMRFAYPKADYEIFKRSHKSFYCPKGHDQYYAEKTKEQKLAERVSQLEKICQSRLNTISYVEKQFYGMKGYAAKLKKRINENEE